MADITMCRDETCDRHEICYRFTAQPNSEYQSYFVNNPKEPNEDCMYFYYVGKAQE